MFKLVQWILDPHDCVFDLYIDGKIEIVALHSGGGATVYLEEYINKMESTGWIVQQIIEHTGMTGRILFRRKE